MPTNEYLAWAVGGGANVENAATFAADPDLAAGFSAGVARSSPANTLWRQHSVVTRALAQMIVDTLAINMRDDGDIANFETQLIAAIKAQIPAASAAEIWAAALATKMVTPLGLKQAMVAQTLTDAATITWDMNSGFRAKVTLGASRTLAAPTNLQEGMTGALQAIQGGAGSNALSFAAGWDFGFAGVPALSTTVGKKDIIYYEVVDAVTPVIRATFNKSA